MRDTTNAMRKVWVRALSMCLIVAALLCAGARAEYRDPLSETYLYLDETTWLYLYDLGYAEDTQAAYDELRVPVYVIAELQARNGLPVTGELDEETLALLDSGLTLPVYYVFMPLHGGKRFHTNADCSNMDGPARVTVEYATEEGFTPCKRCHPLSLSRWEDSVSE